MIEHITAPADRPEDAQGAADPPLAHIVGTVQLMTEEPIEMERPDESPRPLRTLTDELQRRPWLVPAALVAVTALVLAVRHRWTDQPQ